MNRQEFIGRLGNDIEIRKTTNGTSVIEFSLAETEKHKDTEVTTWLRCQSWSGIAELLAKYVKKGDLVYVAGKYRNEKYQAKDGTDRYKTFMLVTDIELLPNRRETNIQPSTELGVPDLSEEDWY